MNMREKSISTATIETNPKVAILLLNYNGWEDAIKCFESVYKITYSNWELIFVDNGSEDGSVSKIKEWAERKPIEYIEELSYGEKEARVKVLKKKEWDTLLPHQKLSILRIEKNRGFTGGNNIGIKYILEEKKTNYILLLSNDTVVDTNFLIELIRVVKSDRKIGICGPKLLSMNNPKIIDSTGHVFKGGRIVDRGQGKFDKGQYDNKTSVIGAKAAACLYRRDMLEDIGLFDENFFMYYEDAELSWRAYKRGWRGRFVPSAIVYHKGGGTTKDNQTEQKMDELCVRNMYITVRNMYTTVRRHGTFYQNLLFPIFLFYTGIKSGVGKWIGRNNIGAKPYINGLKYLWKSEKYR